MAIWGYNTVGASNEATVGGNKLAYKWVAPADIYDADSFSVYMDRTVAGSGFSLYCAVYTDDGGNPGSPVNVVANSDILINSNLTQSSPQWYTGNYGGTKPVFNAGQTYWLCILTTKSERVYYDSVPVGTIQLARCTSINDSDPLNNPFDAVDSRTSQREGSLYITYTPATVQSGSGSISGTATLRGLGSVDAHVDICTFFKPLNEGVNEMAKYKTCVLTRGDEATITSLRGIGYTYPIWQYVRGEAIQNTTGTPAKNQVAWNTGDWADISTNHPDWFLYDTNNQKCVALNGTTYYMMDPASTGWQNFFVSRVNAYQASTGSGFGGVFMDNIEGSLVKRTQQGQTLRDYPTDASYQTAVKSFLTYVNANLTANTVLGNIISVHTTAWEDYVAIMDGGFSEATFVDFHTGYLTVSNWLTDIGLPKVGKKVMLIAQSDNQTDNARQLFCFASYLLIVEDGVSFRFSRATPSAYTSSWWYSDYDYAIGSPTGPYTVSNSIYSRTFTGGTVQVNPDSVAHGGIAAHTGIITLNGTTFSVGSVAAAITGSNVAFQGDMPIGSGSVVITGSPVTLTATSRTTFTISPASVTITASPVTLQTSRTHAKKAFQTQQHLTDKTFEAHK